LPGCSVLFHFENRLGLAFDISVASVTEATVQQ